MWPPPNERRGLSSTLHDRVTRLRRIVLEVYSTHEDPRFRVAALRTSTEDLPELRRYTRRDTSTWRKLIGNWDNFT